MAPLKIELKVSINCNKCKSEVLKAVAKHSGVDQVTVDSQKGIVTVVGEVDPVCLAKQIRKTGKVAEIISVGPPKKPEPAAPKTLPRTCQQCQVIYLNYKPYDSICSIL